jgi:copper transport protein
LKRTWLAIALALAALAAVPSAYAHAILQQSSPSNNSVARTSPSKVSLEFNEAVETAFGSIRVYDCGGGRVDSGKILRPSKSSVAVKIDRKLGRGTYTVTWRVISADSHPVAGAFVFNVGKASASGSCRQVFNAKTPGTVTALFKFMRALDFALILLVVGGAVALAVVLRSAASELRSRLFRFLAGLAFGLVFVGALCIVLQGAERGVSLGHGALGARDPVRSRVPVADRDRRRRRCAGAAREQVAATRGASGSRAPSVADGVRGRTCPD